MEWLAWKGQTNLKRITITIEDSLYDKLPKYGKSGVVSLLIKQHYQNEGIDALYNEIRLRLLKEPAFQPHEFTEVGSNQFVHDSQDVASYHRCCDRYDTQRCIHWVKNADGSGLINKVTLEEVEL